MSSQEVAPVICPQCQARYNAPITSIIDVSQNPGLKDAFLQGQLNVSQCPQCNFSSPLNLPVLYHDSEKELALVLMPGNLHMAHSDEQKIIGDLTNRLMNSLPAEQRKGYLLTPKTFITFDSMVKAILAEDGITEDVLEAQEEKLKLLDKLIGVQDEAQLRQLIKDNDESLDYQFFEILTATAIQILQEGDQARGQNLMAFRQVVAELSSRGQDFIAQIDQKIGLQTLNPDQLLNDLRKAENDDQFLALVAMGKPLLNYAFFQNLTTQIEAAEGNEAEQLKALRSRIFNATARLDEEAKKAISKAEALLKALAEADDPKQFIVEKMESFDDAFMSLLVAKIQEAEQEKRQADVQKLSNLYEQIMATLQEQMPPEMLFLNQLLQSESPEAINALFEQNRQLITPDFIKFLNQIEMNFQGRGQANLAAAIAKIKGLAQARL